MLEMAPIAWKKSVVIDANQHKCQHHNKLPLLNNLNCNTEYLSDTKFFLKCHQVCPQLIGEPQSIGVKQRKDPLVIKLE